MRYRFVLFIICLMPGCDQTKDQTNSTNLSDAPKVENVPKNDFKDETLPVFELFKQDLNKSYSSINRPWVLAKPLLTADDENSSRIMNK